MMNSEHSLYVLTYAASVTSIRDCFVEALEQTEPKVAGRDLQIIESYFGLTGSAPLTLELIGQQLGLTRERVRQLRDRSLDRISTAVRRADPVSHVLVAEIVCELGGVASLTTTARRVEALVKSGGYDTAAYLRFALKAELISSVWSWNSSLLVSTDVSRHQLEKAIGQLTKAASHNDGLSFDAAAAIVEAAIPCGAEGAPDDLVRSMLETTAIEVLPGIWAARRWSAADYAAFVLENEGRPMHYSEIADQVGALRGRPISIGSMNGKLNSDHRFARVGNGDFSLSNSGTRRYKRFDEIIQQYLRDGRKAESSSVIAAELQRTYTIPEATIRTLMNLRKETFVGHGRGYYSLRGEVAVADARLLSAIRNTLLSRQSPCTPEEVINDVKRALDYDKREIERVLFVRPEFTKTGSNRYPKFSARVSNSEHCENRQ